MTAGRLYEIAREAQKLAIALDEAGQREAANRTRATCALIYDAAADADEREQAQKAGAQ